MRRAFCLIVLALSLLPLQVARAEDEPDFFYSDESAMRTKSVTLENGYRFEGFPSGCAPEKASDGSWAFDFYRPDGDMAAVAIAIYARDGGAISSLDAFVEQLREAAPDGMEEMYLSAGAATIELVFEDEESYLYQMGYLEPECAILFSVNARQISPDADEIVRCAHQLYDPSGRKVSAGQYYIDIGFDGETTLGITGLPYGIDASTEDGVTRFTLADFEDESFRRMTFVYYGMPERGNYEHMNGDELHAMIGYDDADLLYYDIWADGNHFDMTLKVDSDGAGAHYVFAAGTIADDVQAVCFLESDHWAAPWYFYDIAHELELNGVPVVTHGPVHDEVE